MSVQAIRSFAMVLLVGALSVPAEVRAQAAAADDKAVTQLEEVVVTGTAGGAEIRKLDASFAITTVSADAITEFSPQSTADLLRLIPGVWTESTGGVSGANVMVRGFPGGGDAPYLTVQVNGSPVYPISTLSFLENTTMFRIDETVQRVEALRGGPNPVFSNGQPGLTTNFILKEGGDETEGIVKYTTSDYDLRRFDGYISGPISDDFYYLIGGYVTSSPGLRDAGYNSDEGNQVTINLTKKFERGKVNVFYRRTDDFGQWYLPVAFNVPGVDASYNQLGPFNRQQQIMTDNPGPGNFANGGNPNAANRTVKTLDLDEGRGWKGSMTGGSVILDITDNWTLTERFGYTSGDAPTVGLVPDGAAVQVGALLANPAADSRAVVTGPIRGAVTGRAIGNSEFIQQFGAWEVRKAVESFTNDISLTWNYDRGSTTFGFYSADASSHDLWALGNSQYQVVESHGEIVTGIACNNPTVVDSCGFNYDIDEVGDATSRALYVATSYKITDALRADVGLRYEKYQVDYTLDEGRAGNIDFAIQDDISEVAWTAALDYQFTDRMGVFARINQGHLLPQFDSYRDGRSALAQGADLIQDIEQYELGFKWGTDHFSLFATAFDTDVDPRNVNFQFGGPAILTTQTSRGIELDGTWRTDAGFSVSVNGTLLKSKIKSASDPTLDGNETERQPSWQWRMTPAYAFNFGNVEGSVYGTFAAVGKRWGEATNINRLDSYEKLDLGVILRVNKAFVVQIAADNVTDEQAFTESDPRTATAPNGRFIMPRSIEFSVGYAF